MLEQFYCNNYAFEDKAYALDLYFILSVNKSLVGTFLGKRI